MELLHLFHRSLLSIAGLWPRLAKRGQRVGLAPASVLALAVIALLSYGCGDPSPPDKPETPRPASSGTGAPTPTAQGPTDAELLRAVQFRQAFGLRDDKAWIIAVAADPTSEAGFEVYGVPLMPAEYRDLLARSANATDIVPILQSYGAAYVETWAGMFIDQETGGALVAQFTDGIEVHRQRLADLLPSGARFDVREVDWTLAELRQFASEIQADSAWFESIDASLYAADVDEGENRVRVRFESRDPALVVAIRAHLGDPAWIELQWKAPPWDGPRGDLVIRVVDKLGQPVRGMSCLWEAQDPFAAGIGAVNRTNRDGRCSLTGIPAVEYLIEIGIPTGDVDTVVATIRAKARAAVSTLVEVVVDRP